MPNPFAVSKSIESHSITRNNFLSSVVAGVLLTGITTISSGLRSTAGAATTASACNKITKAVMVADGCNRAVSPTISSYNCTKPSSNPANALGSTIDFGAKALVVACVSPADIKKLSTSAQGSSKVTMTANQYMAYMVKQSAGAMTKTPVGGASDSLDFGSGKEDGLGSTSTAGSI